MNRWTSVVCAALLLGPLACQPATQQDVRDVKKQLSELEKKIDALDQKLGTARVAAAAPPERPTEDFDKVYKINLEGAPAQGPEDAPVVLVQYSDFQCPFCARADPFIKELQGKYPKQLRVVYKHFPLSFHLAALPSAVASLAAQEQGKFWQFHEVLFKHNEELNSEKLARSRAEIDKAIERYAKEAGLNMARFKKDLKDNGAKYQARVKADYDEGTSVDVRGTPTMYLNGKKLDPSRRTMDAMSEQIDALIAEAKG